MLFLLRDEYCISVVTSGPLQINLFIKVGLQRINNSGLAGKKENSSYFTHVDTYLTSWKGLADIYDFYTSCVGAVHVRT